MQSLITFNLPAIILSIGIFLSVLTGLILIFPPTGRIISNRLLGVLVLGMGMGILGAAILFSPYREAALRLFGVSGFVSFLYGPLLYLYAQSFIQHDFELTRQKSWHFLPSLLILIIQARLLFFPATDKLWLYETIHNGNPTWQARLGGLLVVIHVLIYLILTIRLIRKYQIYTQNSAAFTDESRFKWLVATVSILIIPVMTVIFSALVFGPPAATGRLPYPAFGACFMVMSIHYLYLTQASVFAGFPDTLKIHADSESEQAKYVSSSLSGEQKRRYHQQLLAYIEQEKPYLKQELTRDQLADALKLNSKYLSQVINELQGQNFMDFINSYRIEEAKTKLLHPAWQHYTILAIAQEVGFKSRSAFYSAFKKATGQTPSAFKQKNEVS